MKYAFFNRDISWLSFNERVLLEAAKKEVPLLERIKFLSIYSSNLDEFFRVRMPALTALHRLYQKDSLQKGTKKEYPDIANQAKEIIQRQLEMFGAILTGQLLPELKQKNIHLLYGEPLPDFVKQQTSDYFFSEILAFIQVVSLAGAATNFFPENNKLYMAVAIEDKEGNESLFILNIPSDNLPRFHSFTQDGVQYIVFIDDIIKSNLKTIFQSGKIKGCYNFKITRNAELNLDDEFEGDLAEKIEKQIEKRDYGLATRFLYEPHFPIKHIESIIEKLGLTNAVMVEGGMYHNLKDFFSLPIKNSELSYPPLPAINSIQYKENELLMDKLMGEDIIIHTPYESYNSVLRFFNEAAADECVEEISVTLYRVANDSRIVNALISAAKNGKKVSVFVELKARFDEANNLKWSKKMKAAGIKIIYSIPTLKVHAKIALIKRRKADSIHFFGLLATGNLNESTARIYTDHILLTTNQALVHELEMLFYFLGKRIKPTKEKFIPFNFLLVAQFNLQRRFLELIDTEIEHAQNGLPASIIIKLNNLEERVLIKKLYDASNAGVKITLIVRGICCLIPGVAGMSEHITVKRIVDRYLEHGRVFIFHNKGKNDIYLGSADWMNRNVYRRIEVCFPVYTEKIKNEIIELIRLQLLDNTKAVRIDEHLYNIPLHPDGKPVQSQMEIYSYLSNKTKLENSLPEKQLSK